VNAVPIYEYHCYDDYPARRGRPTGLDLAEQLKALLTKAGIAWQEKASDPRQACEHLVYYDEDDPNNFDVVTDSYYPAVISVPEADADRAREIRAKLRDI
jgi:hypothetical protein